MTRFTALLIVAAGLISPAATAIAQPSPPVQQGIGIRLLEAPAERADDPRARSYIIDHVAPGTRIERDVEVTNGTEDAATLDLYPVGAGIVEGSFTADPGRGRNELAEWMSVTPEQVTLQPNGRATATVVIQIPAQASAGERYAALLVERPPDGGPGQVGVAARVGIRVYLSVGEGGEPATDFAITALRGTRDAERSPVVLADVGNTGGRAIDLSGELTLREGPGGLQAGPFPVTLGRTIAPGSSAPAEIVLDPALPDGPWTATLVLRSGPVERAAEAVITFPSDAGAENPPVAATPADPQRIAGGGPGSGLRLPLLGLAGLLLLLVIAALVRQLLRRARRTT